MGVSFLRCIPNRRKRPAETGLDYFGARYFSGAQGRFTSPDSPFADQIPEDPQSWNLYSYVRNNPLRAIDPTGRCSEAAGGGYTDEGSGLFPGKCSEGQIGGTKPQQVTVGVGQEEANLIMLQMVGERLSSPHQWADLTSHAGQDAAALWGLKSLVEGGWSAVKAIWEAKDAARLANLMNILRQAAKFKGNFGLGSATAEEAEALGKAWVGDGATVASDGKTLVSWSAQMD
jgi:RHS repeat-associated protein